MSGDPDIATNGYVTWRVYERDRRDDQRRDESFRKEVRESFREIFARFDAFQESLTSERVSDARREGADAERAAQIARSRRVRLAVGTVVLGFALQQLAFIIYVITNTVGG
jgi:hypothetical protein